MPLPASQELRTYFATAVTANRRRLFQVEANADLLLKNFRRLPRPNRYQLHAFAVMPDHLHLLLTPAPNVSLEKAMQFIKGGFSFRLKSKLDVWSRSFNQTQILTSEKFEACKTYIEQNPVRAGLTTSPEAFHHSSKQHQQIIDLAPSHLRKIETNHNPIAPKLETKGLQPIRAKREPGRSRGLQAPEIKSQKKGL